LATPATFCLSALFSNLWFKLNLASNKNEGNIVL